MTLRILAEAEEEIDEARRYLNKQSPGLGGRFLDDLADVLDDVAAEPLLQIGDAAGRTAISTRPAAHLSLRRYLRDFAPGNRSDRHRSYQPRAELLAQTTFDVAYSPLLWIGDTIRIRQPQRGCVRVLRGRRVRGR